MKARNRAYARGDSRRATLVCSCTLARTKPAKASRAGGTGASRGFQGSGSHHPRTGRVGTTFIGAHSHTSPPASPTASASVGLAEGVALPQLEDAVVLVAHPRVGRHPLDPWVEVVLRLAGVRDEAP